MIWFGITSHSFFETHKLRFRDFVIICLMFPISYQRKADFISIIFKTHSFMEPF